VLNSPRKPFNLRERLLEFAGLIVRVVQFLHTRGPIGSALSYQLLKCGTSAGANYEEADDGTSLRDKAAKRKIALRELKETVDHDPVINEADELIRILDTDSQHRPRNMSHGWKECFRSLASGARKVMVRFSKLDLGNWGAISEVGIWELT
jgi:four helix bundle protein